MVLQKEIQIDGGRKNTGARWMQVGRADGDIFGIIEGAWMINGSIFFILEFSKYISVQTSSQFIG